MAGIAPAGIGRETLLEVFIANLRHAAARLAKENVRALIEPINYYDIPGYFLNTQRKRRDIIDRVGSNNLFLQQDLYTARTRKAICAEDQRQSRHRVPLPIAGTPGRHEPDVGEINYPFLFN